jgi:rhodanese-related sulfurtransferase
MLAGSLLPARLCRCALRASRSSAVCMSSSTPSVREVSVHELKEHLDAGLDANLIDVREPHEAETASVKHPDGKTALFALRPLSAFASWAPSLRSDFDAAKPTFVLCHGGVRSRRVAEALVRDEMGFTDVRNVSGGIHAWSTEVDSSVPVY